LQLVQLKKVSSCKGLQEYIPFSYAIRKTVYTIRKSIRKNRCNFLFLNYVMKILIITSCCFASAIFSTACKEQTTTANRQAEIDSLKTVISRLKPGLGEFMLQIRYHHDSLGKAIVNKDYERAAYEVDELKETTEKILQLQITNDKLQQPFSFFYEKYLKSPLQTLTDAAAKKDEVGLKNNFMALTNNCNSCHQENNMAFMKIGE
jgi:hypothetical protein